MVTITMGGPKMSSDRSKSWLDENGDGILPCVATALSLGARPLPVHGSERDASLKEAGDVKARRFGVLTEIENLESLRDVRSGLALTLGDLSAEGERVRVEVAAEQPNFDVVAPVEEFGRRRFVGFYLVERVDEVTIEGSSDWPSPALTRS